MSLLDYARYHGLAIDHLANDLARELHDIQSCSLGDPTLADTPHEHFSQLDVQVSGEKLSITRDAARLLNDSITDPPRIPVDLVHKHIALKRLRLEPPLLDRGADKTFSCDQHMAINSILHQAFHHDLHSDCNIDWPPEEQAQASEYNAAIATDKLQSTFEALQRIQDCMKDDFNSRTETEILRSECHITKGEDTKPLSPLLPSNNLTDSDLDPNLSCNGLTSDLSATTVA